MTPTVSIIIPTYNREQWLPVSIGSVQRQSFHDWELLVVDDGSTDCSWDLLRQMADADPRIKPLRNIRKKGVSGARNTGIDAARGEFIAFLDSDDEWISEHLERAVSLLRRHEESIDLVTACVEHRRHPSGEKYGAVEFALEEYDCSPIDGAWRFNPETLFDHAFYRHPVMVTQTIVVRRHVMGDLRFPEDLEVGEDHFFQLELAYRKIQIAHFQNAHVIYWAHGNNTTTAGDATCSPDKTIRLYEGFEREHQKVLSSFTLTPPQRKHVISIMARDRFWQIGYRGHRALGRSSDARRSYLQAILWHPLNLSYWKTYFSSFIHDVFHDPDSPKSAASAKSPGV